MGGSHCFDGLPPAWPDLHGPPHSVVLVVIAGIKTKDAKSRRDAGFFVSTD